MLSSLKAILNCEVCDINICSFCQFSYLNFTNLKTVQLFAHVQNHKICEYVPKSTTTIVCSVQDFACSD